MAYNKKAGIDLHIHTTASDGTLSPSEIILLSQKKGLGAISITDHDSIDANREVLSRGLPNSPKFLTGVEISTQPPEGFHIPGSLHILGYGLDIENPKLNETLRLLQEARNARNPGIIKRLNFLGLEFSISDIQKETGTLRISRPHIAKYMVKRGLVSSIDEAFDKYLGTGKPAYVEKFRISCQKAMELITLSGGLPVLAHPFLLKFKNFDRFTHLIDVLKSFGLKGIEVFYPEHPSNFINKLSVLANKYQLLITGGTDFHGSIKPGIDMGCGTGNFFIPFELYEKLLLHLR